MVSASFACCFFYLFHFSFSSSLKSFSPERGGGAGEAGEGGVARGGAHVERCVGERCQGHQIGQTGIQLSHRCCRQEARGTEEDRSKGVLLRRAPL